MRDVLVTLSVTHHLVVGKNGWARAQARHPAQPNDIRPKILLKQSSPWRSSPRRPHPAAVSWALASPAPAMAAVW